MTDQTTSAPDAADNSKEPGFRIQRIYLKDLSLEQPNAPQILLVAAEPQVEVEVDVAIARMAKGKNFQLIALFILGQGIDQAGNGADGHGHVFR